MNLPDLVNGGFELIGGSLVFNNCLILHRDRAVRGVSALTQTFFASWGFYNPFLYSHLHLWFSFSGGLVLALGNVTWLALAFHYRRGQS